LTLTEKIFELIDMRSFSNLWYWLFLSVFWSASSYYTLGVPAELLRRARGTGGQALADVETLATLQARRLLTMFRRAGVAIVAFACFLHSMLLAMAVGYSVEFAQAVLCFSVPLTLLIALSLRTARMVEAGDASGAPLLRRLRRQRVTVQAIGMVSIFFTALFGMYQNMTIGVFG
jgi:hypothetical protein